MSKDITNDNVFQTSEEAVAWITGLMPTIGIRPGLERMTLLLEQLGNPERRLKFIHVAGTNGKGSVCSMLTSVLRRSGYDVGTFTSPYITSYADRFQYNEEQIPAETLLLLANRLKPFADEMERSEWGPLTMFELTTALAILFFSTVTYPDFVVWETGMGGRLDVTNVVTPIVSVITNIGHDHMDLLGPTLIDVAREKAGIIKAGVPVISTAAQPEVIAVLREVAAAKQTTLYQLGDQFTYESQRQTENGQQFVFRGLFRTIDEIVIGLNGAHQQTNAAAAIMTLEVLRQYYALVVEDEDLYASLRAVVWPGRLEMVSEEPRILIDGAHNPEGMAALAAALRDVYSYDSLNMMVGMMPNKNHEDTLRHILPMVNTLVITEPDFHKRMNASELAAVAGRLVSEAGGSQQIIVEPDWRRGFELLTDMAKADTSGRTLTAVTGTLYLIADVRSWVLHQTNSEKGW